MRPAPASRSPTPRTTVRRWPSGTREVWLGAGCIHWINTGKDRWIRLQRQSGWQILAVELAGDAIALPRLAPAAKPTVVLLGHETQGVPAEHVGTADICVEIPVVGSGASLNVAVAGSLVLYRLAGLA
jgi:tRNA (guanosine-2'-O-)-methyltransferase